MTPGRLKIWNEDAGEWQYPPGGSPPGTAVWYGPYHLSHTDFPTGNDTVTLFDTTAGDILVGAFWDVATAENWDSEQAPDIAFAEGTPLVDDTAAWTIDCVKFAATSPLAHDLSGNATGTNFNGSNVGIGPRVFTGGSFKAAMSSGGASATGEVDLYFAIATPAAP